MWTQGFKTDVGIRPDTLVWTCRELILAPPCTLRGNNVRRLRRHFVYMYACYEEKGDVITTSEDTAHRFYFLNPLLRY